MMGQYTNAFRAKMVQRLLAPDAPTCRELSKRTGVPRSTLELWKRVAMGRGSWNNKRKTADQPRRPEDWTAQERMRVVIEAEGLGPAELGEFLRREGLHEATLAQWKQAATEALSPSNRDPKAQRIAELEKQLARKDKALAETAALLLLQKKVQALWAVADDDIAETTESASLPSSTKR